MVSFNPFDPLGLKEEEKKKKWTPYPQTTKSVVFTDPARKPAAANTVSSYRSSRAQSQQEKQANKQVSSVVFTKRDDEQQRQREYAALHPTANMWAPSEYYKERTDTINKVLANDGKAVGPNSNLTEYYRLERRLGKDNLYQRIKVVKDMWDVYGEGMAAGSVVWAFVKSEFSIEEIRNMMEAAQSRWKAIAATPTMMNIQDPASEDDDIGVRNALRAWEQYRYKMEGVKEKSDKGMQAALGIAAMGASGPAIAGLVNTGTRLARAGSKVLKIGRLVEIIPTFQLGFGAAVEAAEKSRLGGIEEKASLGAAKLERVATPMGPEKVGLDWVADSSFHNEDSKSFQELADIRDFVGALTEVTDREGVKKVEEYWKAIGIDVVPDGVIDWDDRSAVLDAAKSKLYDDMEKQREAVEKGDAPYWAPINGDMESSQWPEWHAKYNARETAAEAAKEANPAQAAWYDMAEWPRNRYEAEALWNRVRSQGTLQMLYSAPLKVAEIAGATYNAVLSARNLRAREDTNKRYQSLVGSLKEIMADNPSDLTVSTFGDKLEATLWSGDYDLVEAYNRIEDPNGDLHDDEEAQRVWGEIKREQASMIDERYAPDMLLTAGYMAGFDPDEVSKFGTEHPDFIRAFDVAADVGIAIANPLGKLRRMATRPTVRTGRASNFLRSGRALKYSDRVADYTYSGLEGIGRAASYLGGRAAGQTVTDFWRYSGKKNPKVDYRSGLIQQIATKAADAIQTGNIPALNRTFRSVDADFVDGLARKVDGKYGTYWKQTDNMSAAARAERMQVKKKVVDTIARDLANRQTKVGDVVTKDAFRKAMASHLADTYASGKDIMPYLKDSKLVPRNRLIQEMTDRTAAIPNDWLRGFVTKFVVGQLVRAPIVETEFFSPESLDRAFDAAMAVSQDAAWASVFRSRWASARTTGQFKRLVDELDAKFGDKFYTSKSKDGFNETLSYYLNKEYEAGGMALAPDPQINAAVLKNQGQDVRLLTQYKTVAGELKQAVPDTVYMKAFAQMHRSALWAPYRIPKDASILSKAILNTKNITYRLPLNLAHRVSTPLRQLSVAVGAPMLFQKHALADTTRTVMEYGPQILVEAMGLKAVTIKGRTVIPRMRSIIDDQYESVLRDLDASYADVVRGDNQRGHWSEAQYNSGKYRRKFRPKTIRDAEGAIVNLEESAHALRRITQGEAFKAWSRGYMSVADTGTSASRYMRQLEGYKGLERWLNSKEGRLFLRESNWYDKTETIMFKEKGLPTKGKQKQIHEATVQEYLETMVDREWGRIDSQMPYIMDEMRNMAMNDKPMTVDAIGELIKANPGENAVLSTQAIDFQHNGMLGYIVGKAMYMNKWNRDVVFKREFVNQYHQLVKDGVDPNQAALSASTVALNNVSRIHFDLANALTIEARHRWAAWFATKHRLYATYMAKLVADRPMLAGAALEIADWMEERNERDGQTGFDKGDFIFSVAGHEFRINLAPYYWLTDYPLESTMLALLEEETFTNINEIAGADWLHPSPSPFGHGLFRGDEFIMAGLEARSFRGVETEEDLQAWLDNKSQEDQERWNKLINRKRAEFLAKGQEITPLEAAQMVQFANVKAEAWKAFRPFSGTIKGNTDLHIEKLLQQYADLAETDPEAASDLMKAEPELAACFNATLDPVEKYHIDEGWRQFNQLQDAFQLKLEQEDDAGTLIENYDELVKEYRDCIDKLMDPDSESYNESFAKVFSGSNPQELLDAIGFITPVISPDSIVRVGLPWDEDRRKEAQKRLETEDLMPVLEAEGMTETQPDGTVVVSTSAKSSVYYKILKEKLVDKPLADLVGYDDNPLYKSSANSVARYLARGGETGVYRKDQFLELVKSRRRREPLAAKISDGMGSKSDPWLATMSDLDAELLGINRNPESRVQWEQWAATQWSIRNFQRENKISPTSALGKKQWEAFEQQNEQRAMEHPDWGQEWKMSRSSMADRLNMFGIGQGTDAESRVWGEFIGIASDYMYEMKNTWNTYTKKYGYGPRSQTVGREMVEKYIDRVANLARENPDWWKAFQDNFTATKFGFYWHSTNPDNNFIFGSTSGPTVNEASEEEWYTIWQEEAGVE